MKTVGILNATSCYTLTVESSPGQFALCARSTAVNVKCLKCLFTSVLENPAAWLMQFFPPFSWDLMTY